MSVRSAITAGRAERYQQQLSHGWALHLAPRAPDAPIVISLFAGCGGSSLGYSMAGYRELLAVDFQPVACRTFRANFPLVPLHEGDISQLDCAEAERLALSALSAGARGASPASPGTTGPHEAAGLMPQSTGSLSPAPGPAFQLDLLDGSPPCQGFSTAGRRHFDDHRNQLFREYVRFLTYFRPRMFVMENVPGLVKGKMRLIFVEILTALKGAGYRVAVRQLNAMYYGVPQSRNRLIFIGIRDDLPGIPTHPASRQRPYTVEEALLQCEEAGEEGLQVRTDREQMWAIERTKAGEKLSDYHPGKYWFNYVRLYRTQAARTFTTDVASHVFHYTEDRLLSSAEMKRLASFPDAYSVVGTRNDVGRQIGNAVPPFFMKAIAEHCKTVLEATYGTTEQADARSA